MNDLMSVQVPIGPWGLGSVKFLGLCLLGGLGSGLGLGNNDTVNLLDWVQWLTFISKNLINVSDQLINIGCLSDSIASFNNELNQK